MVPCKGSSCFLKFGMNFFLRLLFLLGGYYLLVEVVVATRQWATYMQRVGVEESKELTCAHF